MWKRARGGSRSLRTAQTDTMVATQCASELCSYVTDYRGNGTKNTFVYVPGYNTARSIMVLAMHYAPRSNESDTVRIEALMDEGWSVSSVDMWNHQDTTGHITMNFKSLRAIRRLIKEYPAPRVLVLDYFWLQQNYYEENYGENWAKKAKMLFEEWSGLEAIVLPIDDPKTRSSSMRKQLKQLDASLSHIEIGPDDDVHPLVRCTRRSESALAAIDPGRTHDAQKWRISGFALIFRVDVSPQALAGTLVL